MKTMTTTLHGSEYKSKIVTKIFAVCVAGVWYESRHKLFEAHGRRANGVTELPCILPGAGLDAVVRLHHSYGNTTGFACTQAEVIWSGRVYAFDTTIWA